MSFCLFALYRDILGYLFIRIFIIKKKHKSFLTFSPKQNTELQKIFHDADEDSSGSIDKKEFKKLVKKLNIFPGEKEFESLFRECDQDGKKY